jgi:hypothetical protein
MIIFVTFKLFSVPIFQLTQHLLTAILKLLALTIAALAKLLTLSLLFTPECENIFTGLQYQTQCMQIDWFDILHITKSSKGSWIARDCADIIGSALTTTSVVMGEVEDIALNG